MPYKDKNKERDAAKIRMRRYRQRLKKKTTTYTAQSKDGTPYSFELIIKGEEEATPEALQELQEIEKAIKRIVSLIETADPQTLKKINADLRRLCELCEKIKKPLAGALLFIPNLLSLGTDLQMLKHRGGTA